MANKKTENTVHKDDAGMSLDLAVGLPSKPTVAAKTSKSTPGLKRPISNIGKRKNKGQVKKKEKRKEKREHLIKSE